MSLLIIGVLVGVVLCSVVGCIRDRRHAEAENREKEGRAARTLALQKEENQKELDCQWKLRLAEVQEAYLTLVGCKVIINGGLDSPYIGEYNLRGGRVINYSKGHYSYFGHSKPGLIVELFRRKGEQHAQTICVDPEHVEIIT